MPNESRYTRYLNKIAHGEKRIKNITEWSSEPTVLEDEKTLLAIFKAAQEVIEILMDLLAMLLKDNDHPPKDDYSNIDKAFEEKIITKQERDVLKELNGLRNRLVHDYNELDNEIVLRVLERTQHDTKEILQKVKAWSKKFFK